MLTFPSTVTVSTSPATEERGFVKALQGIISYESETEFDITIVSESTKKRLPVRNEKFPSINSTTARWPVVACNGTNWKMPISNGRTFLKRKEI